MSSNNTVDAAAPAAPAQVGMMRRVHEAAYATYEAAEAERKSKKWAASRAAARAESARLDGMMHNVRLSVKYLQDYKEQLAAFDGDASEIANIIDQGISVGVFIQNPSWENIDADAIQAASAALVSMTPESWADASTGLPQDLADATVQFMDHYADWVANRMSYALMRSAGAHLVRLWSSAARIVVRKTTGIY